MNSKTCLEKCWGCEEYSPRDHFKWELREMVARKASTTIWGNDYIFQSGEEKIEKAFAKFKKINKLSNLFSFMERNLSMYGRVIITINKTKQGEIMLNLPNPSYFQGVGKVFVQPQLAVIWQRFNIDTKMYVVKSTYDCEKVVNELYTSENDKVIRVFDKEAEILKELQLEKVWYHNLGFPPIVEFTNLSFFQCTFDNEAFITLTDWYPAEKWEDLIYSTIDNLKKELYLCHSRVSIQNANQELITQFKLMGQKANIDIGDYIMETDIGSDIKVIPGNGDFTKYTNAIEHLMDFYFKFCGGSKFSEGGGAQKTVAETSSIRSNMIENVTNKIILRQNQIEDLLKKVFCAMGLIKDYWSEEVPFTFEINGNISKDETSIIDNLIKQVDNGFMSVEEAIQEIRNLGDKEAKEKFQAIKQFNEENNIMLLNNASFEEGEEDNFDKASGEHQDKAKKGEV